MKNLSLRLFVIDLRALAALRIGLGLLLLFDLAKRAQSIGLWYVNEGLLPNHRLLWRPYSPYQLSYLFSLWTRSQVETAFCVMTLVYLAFLVGYRTRIFHVLSWFCLLSIHTRLDLVANGGDYVFCTLLLWTAFLPLGARFSWDALLRADPLPSQDYRSLAVLALRLQLIVIYLFNALNKSGGTWRKGTAIHYVLYQARIVTPIGLWVREHAPLEVLRALAYGTLVIEYAAPLLIVFPWLGPWPRRIAIVLLYGLHIGIACLVNVGVFSPVMLVFALSLLGPQDFEWLATRSWIHDRASRAHARLRELATRFRIRRPDPNPHVTPLTPLGARLRVACRWLRDATLSVLMLCAFSQLVVENRRALSLLSHEQPRFVSAVIGYLRLNQGWGMFAPNAPLDDTSIVVDAVTRSGRHVDPYNELASDIADPALRTIPARLDQDVYFCDYTARIVGEDHFHDVLKEWILEYASRTQRAEDGVERFDAYVIEQHIPKFGETAPPKTTARVFLSGVSEP